MTTPSKNEEPIETGTEAPAPSPYAPPEVFASQRTVELIQGAEWCGHDSPTSWGDIHC